VFGSILFALLYSEWLRWFYPRHWWAVRIWLRCNFYTLSYTTWGIFYGQDSRRIWRSASEVWRTLSIDSGSRVLESRL
jgi:hypothetical protein